MIGYVKIPVIVRKGPAADGSTVWKAYLQQKLYDDIGIGDTPDAALKDLFLNTGAVEVEFNA